MICPLVECRSYAWTFWWWRSTSCRARTHWRRSCCGCCTIGSILLRTVTTTACRTSSTWPPKISLVTCSPFTTDSWCTSPVTAWYSTWIFDSAEFSCFHHMNSYYLNLLVNGRNLSYFLVKVTFMLLSPVIQYFGNWLSWYWKIFHSLFLQGLKINK